MLVEVNEAIQPVYTVLYFLRDTRHDAQMAIVRNFHTLKA